MAHHFCDALFCEHPQPFQKLYEPVPYLPVLICALMHATMHVTTTPGTKLTIQTPNNTDGFSHVSDGGIVLTERVGGVSASIGTSSNHTFRLVANNVAAININPDGHVGLGTTDPGNFKLKISD